MATKLTELLDTKNNHPLVLEFQSADAKAQEIRTYMAKNNVPHTIGVMTTLANMASGTDVEHEGFSAATSALYIALQYITEEGTRPLTIDDYLAIQERVIEKYPHSLWDHGMWFKRVGKEVRDYSLPVTAEVQDILRQNASLMQEYTTADFYAHETGKDIIEILRDTKIGNVTSLVIEEGKEFTTETTPPAKPSDDALLMYLTLTGKLPKSEMS
ncbi:hypothetical protein HQ489_04785 [Candidatus Woesearchaeota archaeon]|nr:hypothetical protein [Candidatus Woesearchaeota archaeon]